MGLFFYIEIHAVSIRRVQKRELTGSTVNNYLKSIKLFCEMADISMSWKKISRGLPRGRKYADDRIPTEEILDDFGINTTESVIVGTDRIEVLNRIQTTFAREFERYGKLKEPYIRPMNYETKQASTRIRRHIKEHPN